VKLLVAIQEVKLEQISIVATPELKFYLPNGAIDLKLNENIMNTMVDFAYRYDLYYSFIYSKLDCRYNFSDKKYFLGLDLLEQVYFETLFSPTNMIQRVRHIMPYLGYNLTKDMNITGSIIYENTYSATVDTALVLDKGKNFHGQLNLFYNTLDENKPLPKGNRISVNIKHSLGELGSEYDYTQLDTNLTKYIYLLGINHMIRTCLQLGYPLYTKKRPLSDIYYMGGYNILHGYKFNEFSGNTMIYTRLSYHIPLILNLHEENLLSSSIEIVTTDLVWEFAKIGDTKIFDTVKGMKSSVGIGAGAKVRLFNVLNLQFNLLIAQAISIRAPVIHFTLTAISYIAK